MTEVRKSMRIRQVVKDITWCPECRCILKWHTTDCICSRCRAKFPIEDGIVNFLTEKIEETEESKFQIAKMTEGTWTGRLYEIGKRVVSSHYVPRDHMRELLDTFEEESVVVVLGSGTTRLRPQVINMDIFPLPNVDIMADIKKTPFRGNSVDYVIVDNVLEHVPEPHKCVDEIHRILKPGGKVACITPFVFPYHAYPKHYCNFSRDGLEFLFRKFSACKIEMHIGPTGALTNLISEYIAVALSGQSRLAYGFWKGVSLLPIFFLKYMDKFWAGSKKSVRIASTLYIVAIK